MGYSLKIAKIPVIIGAITVLVEGLLDYATGEKLKKKIMLRNFIITVMVVKAVEYSKEE